MNDSKRLVSDKPCCLWQFGMQLATLSCNDRAPGAPHCFSKYSLLPTGSACTTNTVGPIWHAKQDIGSLFGANNRILISVTIKHRRNEKCTACPLWHAQQDNVPFCSHVRNPTPVGECPSNIKTPTKASRTALQQKLGGTATTARHALVLQMAACMPRQLDLVCWSSAPSSSGRQASSWQGTPLRVHPQTETRTTLAPSATRAVSHL
jgi:hypothetical protein